MTSKSTGSETNQTELKPSTLQQICALVCKVCVTNSSNLGSILWIWALTQISHLMKTCSYMKGHAELTPQGSKWQNHWLLFCVYVVLGCPCERRLILFHIDDSLKASFQVVLIWAIGLCSWLCNWCFNTTCINIIMWLNCSCLTTVVINFIPPAVFLCCWPFTFFYLKHINVLCKEAQLQDWL